MHRTALRNGRNLSIAIQRVQSKLKEIVSLPEDLQSCQTAIRKTRSNLRELVKASNLQRKLRSAERLEAFVEQHRETMGKKKAESLYKRSEAMKKMFSNMPSIKPKPTGGTTNIQLPAGGIIEENEDGKLDNTHLWMTITDSNVIEEQLLARNRRHFRQAEDTPLASKLVQEKLTFAATSAVAEEILDGSPNLSQLTSDLQAQRILHSCQRKEPEITAEVNRGTIGERFRAWRVSTSTSPSNRHLDHYHCMFKPHGEKNNSEAGQEWKSQQGRILGVHSDMIQYAAKHGYCYDRWKNVTTTMIEKDPGDPKINRLRVIHLMEADYSCLMSVIFRQLMYHNEDGNLLNDGCYGSRANRSATDPVLLEVLQREYSWFTRTPQIKFFNDATACYDRIIPSIANLVARAFGLPKEIAQIHGDMLHDAKYRIKTKIGVSEEHYQHSEDDPVFGTGQGSIPSPPIVAMVFSVCFDIFEEFGHGATYTDSKGDEYLRVGMTGFVDDNNQNTTKRKEESEEDMIARCCEDAQLWHDILWASGGSLEVSKCSYQFLKFEFNDDGTPVSKKGSHGPPVVIKDSTGNPMHIKQLSVDEAYKILGTYQADVSDQTKQFEILYQKSLQHAKAISRSTVSRYGAWIYYSSCFLPSICYPLATCHLTERQLHKLQSTMVASTLPKMGFSSTYSHAVVFGPRDYGGLGFHDLRIEQGVLAVKSIIRSLRSDHQTRKMLLITLDRAQIIAGTSDFLLEEPHLSTPHLPGYWISSVRNFLASIKGQLQIDGLQIQPTLRINDRYIMDMARWSLHLGPTDTNRLNACRLYLGVLTFSDIVTGDGKFLLPGVYEGKLEDCHPRSLLQPIPQNCPNEKSWSVWKKFLNVFLESSHPASKKLKVALHLGPWFKQTMYQRSLWRAVYLYRKNTLYLRQHDQYVPHRQVRPTVYARDTSKAPIPFSQMSKSAIPVDVVEYPDGLRIPSHLASNILPLKTSKKPFLEHLQSLPDYQSKLFPCIQWAQCENVQSFCNTAADLSKVKLTSDGGSKLELGKGSFGWVISTIDGDILVKGRGPVYGLEKHSFRSEGTGLKAGLLFILLAFEYTEMRPEGKLKAQLDNTGNMKKLEWLKKFRLAQYSSPFDPEWDILISIHDILQRFDTEPTISHVKGHQDDNTVLSELSVDAKLNIEADALATEELNTDRGPTGLVPFDPSSKVQLNIHTESELCTITRQIIPQM